MELTHEQSKKFTPGFAEQIIHSTGTELVTVGMTIIGEGDTPEPDPAEFEDMVDYRKACVAHHRAYLQNDISEILLALRELPIVLATTSDLHAVIVQGAIETIIKASFIPGVRHIYPNEC